MNLKLMSVEEIKEDAEQRVAMMSDDGRARANELENSIFYCRSASAGCHLIELFLKIGLPLYFKGC